MTYIHTSRLYFGLPLLILCFQRCCSTTAPSVQCKIINLEYVECIWNTSTMNYTFSSRFKHDDLHVDCPKYILKHNYTVGCRTPMKNKEQRFFTFYTNVSTEGNHTISSSYFLERKVQLDPPYNLSVKWTEHNSSLLLQWNSSAVPIRNDCVVYMVRNQKDPRQSLNVTGMSYSEPQVSQKKQYVFQVRRSLADLCTPSDLWSDWSDPVEWGNSGNISQQGWLQGLYVFVSVTLFFLLGGLLCYCERKRIILLRVGPDPSKNLQDLFQKHDGNVESWIHISKELKEAFQPDYTEPSCDVCEVTPSADARPTPDACPAPQTDNCDEQNTEEKPADQQSS